jgi:hypothetical protein
MTRWYVNDEFKGLWNVKHKVNEGSGASTVIERGKERWVTLSRLLSSDGRKVMLVIAATCTMF